MARLLLESAGRPKEIFELGPGVNRLGRAEACDFFIDHYSISGVHCEFVLTPNGLLVRDCNSTNGTLVDGQVVKEAWLTAGQVVQIGAMQLKVDLNQAEVIIPEIQRNIPAPPVVLPDGSILCRRHPTVRATHRCTHCKELLCDACVHRLRRRGGELHKFCALCSHHCEALEPEKPKKKSLMDVLKTTIRMPFHWPKANRK